MSKRESATTRTPAQGLGAPDRIRQAARELFFEHGFAAVSTDMLAKHAKVSKATLYKNYQNMSEVLVAVLRAEAERFESGVPGHADNWDDFRDAMIKYGTSLLRFLNDPDIIRFTQLVHEEARLHPGVAAPFYSSAYAATHRHLTEMIAHGEQAGYLKTVGSAEETAEQLLGMWEPLRWTKALIGLATRPYPRPKDWATKCVDALLGPSRLES